MEVQAKKTFFEIHVFSGTISIEQGEGVYKLDSPKRNSLDNFYSFCLTYSDNAYSCRQELHVKYQH